MVLPFFIDSFSSVYQEEDPFLSSGLNDKTATNGRVTNEYIMGTI
jgi:hypothetical protein